MTTFREMHRKGDPFILANAWDLGSAQMLVALGAKAIGTTSSGFAFTRGKPDGGAVGRDEAIAHAADLAAHLDVPVSADLENGYGDSPEACATTVRLAVEAGLAGCCLEDVDPDGQAYDPGLARERMVAAVEAVRAAPGDFVFCARADGILHGAYDVEEAIRRLQSFEAVGADILYAPLPPTLEDQARICAAVERPVNALVAGPFRSETRASLAQAGVARISLGSTLARATQRVIRDAAQAMFGEGDFGPMAKGVPSGVVDGWLADGARKA